MMLIETVCLRLESVVVGQGAVVPVETSHLVNIIANVDMGLAGHKPVEEPTDVQGVARQMELEACLADGETVCMDAPLQGGWCRVGSCRIIERNVQTSLL